MASSRYPPYPPSEGRAERQAGVADSTLGVVAAGHPLTAQAGAQTLRAGGNAVDAAVAALLTSFVAEPLLTGLGAGGHLMVAGFEEEPTLLDFFVSMPRGRVQDAPELLGINVDFGDTAQVYYVGPASCGVYGAPAGVCEAMRRWGTLSLQDLAGPAARLAREGVAITPQQGYVAEILEGILTSTPECAALWAPQGEVLRAGDVLCNPELGDALERLGREGAAPFYEGDVAQAVASWITERGGSLTADELAGFRVIERRPMRLPYRDREVLTNPPPAAGGILLAYALSRCDRVRSPPSVGDIVEAMSAAQEQRTPEFVTGLSREDFLATFTASRLGSTTHVAVLDAGGRACSVTTTNGEGSGIVVPGTGIHLNNILAEEDLNPLGFHTHPPGARLPSMVAPTILLRDGEVELVLGSAGSNRIRSALLQTIVAVVDHELDVAAAVAAPRLHYEADTVYAEPGIDDAQLRATGRRVVRFRAPNLFFGGVQAVQRAATTGELRGAGDARRGGAAVRACDVRAS